MRVLLALLFTAGAAWSQNTGQILGDRNSLISGESLQLRFVLRDLGQNPLTGGQAAWLSSDSNIAAVDANGLVTANRLGIATITAQSLGATDKYSIQVLPSTIKVTPATATLRVGDRQQYSVSALDIKGNTIPGAAFNWRVYFAEFTNTSNSADITANGLLTAKVASRLTVRAEISYPNALQNQTPLVFGASDLRILSPQTYSFTRVPLAIAAQPRAMKLKGAASAVFATARGTLIFRGVLDGLANGLFEWDNGTFRMLLPAGGGGSLPHSLVGDYPPFQFAGNRNGDVLVQETPSVGGFAISALSNGVYTNLAGGGSPIGNGQFVQLANLSQSALANSGAAALYALANTTAHPEAGDWSIFRGDTSRLLEQVVSIADPLPGFQTRWNIGVYTIADDGTVYWYATSGGQAGIYRAVPGKAVERVLGIGDPFMGSTVTAVVAGNQGAPLLRVAGNGDVYFGAALANGATRTVRLPGGDVASAQVTGYGGGFFPAADSDYGVLVWGNLGGPGLYLWRGGTPRLLLRGGSLVDGSPIENVLSCAFLPGGVPGCLVSTTASAMVAIRVDSTPTVLFREGDSISVHAPLNVVSGIGLSAGGTPMFVTGGLPGSPARLNHDGSLSPLLQIGDRLPNGTRFPGTTLETTGHASDGSLYVSSNGVFRVTSAGATIAVPPFQQAGATISSYRVNAASTSGNVVWVGGDSTGGTGLWVTVGGVNTEIMRANDTAAPTTIPGFGRAQPSFGVKSAIDDRGRVLTTWVQEGSNGNLSAAWDGSQWTAVWAQGAFTFGGQPLNYVSNLRSWGGHLLALLSLSRGSIIAEWTGTGWSMVFDPGKPLPNGGFMPNVQAFEVSSKGDLAISNGDGTESMILLQRADGSRHVLWSLVDYRPGDPLLFAANDFQVADDGSVYVLALDESSNRVLYVARPLGSAPAACSFALASSSSSAAAAGGNLSVTVNTGAGCTWSAASDAAWISVVSDVHTGSGAVSFTAAANSGPARKGTVTAGGQRFTVSQDASSAPPVVISAVYDTWGYTSGAAPGLWVTIGGSNLAAGAPAVWDPTGASVLATTLGGTGVTFNGAKAAVLYVSATQINALVPASIVPGPVQVVVTSNGVPSAPFTVTAAATQPAIYTVAAADGSAFYVTGALAGTGTLVGNKAVDERVIRGAHAGEAIDLYMIGLGATSDATQFNTSTPFSGGFPVSAAVTVAVDGATVTPIFAGLISPGLYLVRFTVPAGAAPGMRPIQVQAGTAKTRASVFLAVE